jgi:hypothetical protein
MGRLNTPIQDVTARDSVKHPNFSNISFLHYRITSAARLQDYSPDTQNVVRWGEKEMEVVRPHRHGGQGSPNKVIERESGRNGVHK